MGDRFAKAVHNIWEYVENIRGPECPVCKATKTYIPYEGQCTAYTWDYNYIADDTWSFSLYCHKKRIWYFDSQSSGLEDFLELALEELKMEKWKVKKE